MSQKNSSEAEQHKQRVAKTFDGAAPTYGQVGPAFFSHFGRRLVEFVGIPDGSQVIDIATGRGAVLFPAAEAVGSDGKVTGIDLSEMMVQETKAEIARLKMAGNIEVQQMDAENLQFPDDLFDFVLCGFAIFFFPQLFQAMAEFRRVLKPDGIICVSTFDKLFDDEWIWLDEIVSTYLPSESGAAEDTDPDSESQPVFDTPEGLRAIMNTAGFENIQIFTETAEFIYATEEEFWSTLWSHGFRGTMERIEKERGPDGLQRFKLEVFNKINSIKRTDGLHQLIPVHVSLATKPKI
jgi:ubiquinone/menaquinone biosynthesis C-methylase UbiE